MEAANTIRSRYARARYVALRWIVNHPLIVQVAIWVLVMGSMAIGIWMWSAGKLQPENVGYTAAFYLNLVGSASIIIPVPGVLAVCVAADESLGLNLELLSVIGAMGAALGETTAYLAGYAGHGVVESSRWYPRVRNLVQKHGAVTIFTLSVIPNPFFDIAGIAAGTLHYSYLKFIAYSFAGKLLRLIIMSYACRESIHWLETFFNFQLPGLG